MRVNLCVLGVLLSLGMPGTGQAQSCAVAGEPWQSVQSAWQASWDRPLSFELRAHAHDASVQAGLPSSSVESLRQSRWLQAGTQALALASVLALLLAWRSVRRGAWRMPLLAFGLAALSLGLGFFAEHELRIMIRQADVRTAPRGSAAVVDHVPTGSVGQCDVSPTDSVFCFWHARSGAQGWVERCATLPVSVPRLGH